MATTTPARTAAAPAQAESAPAPPTTVGPRTSLPALYRLFLRNQATPGRIVLLSVLGLIGVLLGVALAADYDNAIDPINRAAKLIDGFGLILLAPVVSLVFASSTFGDLNDDKNLVYLWLRPVPRLHVVIAAAASSLTICLPLVAIPLVAASALAGKGDAALIGGTAVASLVAVVGYVGLFTTLGLRFRRALVWGIAYILLWEGFIASAGKTASKLALRAYTRSIVSEYTGVGLKLADLALPVAIVVPIAVSALALLYASRRLAHQDVD